MGRRPPSKKGRTNKILAWLRRNPRKVRDAAVLSYVLLHTVLVLWLLIPPLGYAIDDASHVLPGWFERAEDGLSRWRLRSTRSRAGRAAASYFSLTGMWQKWWLFAPNPVNEVRWITVHAIVGHGEHDKVTSAEERIAYNSLLSEAEGFTDDTKMVENLDLPGWAPALEAFGRYWLRTSSRNWGLDAMTPNRLLSMKIILHERRVPPDPAGPPGIPRIKVLWSRQY